MVPSRKVSWNFKFSRQWGRRCCSSEVWCRVDRSVDANALEKHTACIFWVEDGDSMFLRNVGHLPTSLHGAKTQKNKIVGVVGERARPKHRSFLVNKSIQTDGCQYFRSFSANPFFQPDPNPNSAFRSDDPVSPLTHSDRLRPRPTNRTVPPPPTRFELRPTRVSICKYLPWFQTARCTERRALRITLAICSFG
jgi:hypothetical protein